MREMEFKMEREGLLKEGDTVTVEAPRGTMIYTLLKIER